MDFFIYEVMLFGGFFAFVSLFRIFVVDNHLDEEKLIKELSKSIKPTKKEKYIRVSMMICSIFLLCATYSMIF